MKELIQFVQSAESQAPSLRLAEKQPSPDQPSFSDRKAFTRWLAETVQNKRHPSGRINFYGLDHPSPAHTVCPYAPHFFDNIEDGIKPLVEALFNKGYLTFSSCAGHRDRTPRYVALAFPSEEERQYFSDRITRRFRPWIGLGLVRLTFQDTMANSQVRMNASGAFNGIERLSEPTPEGEAEYFSTIFYRTYPSWYFLRLSLGHDLSSNGGPQSAFLKAAELAWTLFSNRFLREPLTRALVRQIRSGDFPAFMG